MKKIFELQWPSGGLERRFSYQNQRPFTSPDCLNVRPYETFQGRERGGSRPGLSRAYLDQLGSGNPVRMLQSVSVVQSNGLSAWVDNFRGTALGSAWSVANWGSLVIPTVLDNYADIVSGSASGAVRSDLTTIDVSQAYLIELFIVPYQGAHHGKYQIFARMNTSTPVGTTDGVIGELQITGSTGVFTGTLKEYVASVNTNTWTFAGGTDGSATPGIFSMLISGTTVTCYWRGVSQTSQTAAAAAGRRFGFGINTTVAGGICLVDTFRVQYNRTDNAQVTRRILVASSNGSVYKEGYYGDFNAATATSLTLASDRQLMANERAQVLYIADNGHPRKIGTAGVTDGGGTVLDDASVADWTALSISTNDDVVVILSGTGATAGTYTISSIHATNGLTLSTSAGASASSISYRVERAPKIYDPVADTLTKWTASASNGQVPTGCPILGMYRDRMVLAGAPAAPHVWYMSRQGDPLDWDYADSASDAQRAVAGTSADAGRIGEPIKAFIPHSDDYAIFGCENSLWVLRGDPALGGMIDNLSYNVGVVDKKAWCKGPNGEIVIMSRDGLYMIPPGAQGYPQSISRERLPYELMDIENTSYTVCLEYDFRDRGIHIFMTGVESRSQYHWWFDWQTRGFWPLSLPATMEPTTTLGFVSSQADDSAVLLGCRDGYIRKFQREQVNDDGTTITSHVLYGPIRLGDTDYHEGMLTELVGVPATDSGDVDWAVLPGESQEAAADASSFVSGEWNTAGLNLTVHPRVTRHAVCVKLTNGETGRAWAMDRMVGVRRSLGKQRILG